MKKTVGIIAGLIGGLAMSALPASAEPATLLGVVHQLVGLFLRHGFQHDLLRPVQAAGHPAHDRKTGPHLSDDL